MCEFLEEDMDQPSFGYRGLTLTGRGGRGGGSGEPCLPRLLSLYRYSGCGGVVGSSEGPRV